MFTDETIMTTNRRLLAPLTAVVLCGMLVTVSGAAVQSGAVSAIAPPPVNATAAGDVFVDGVRTQDEIVVVNTRHLGCTCHGESLRRGLRFETYAIHDDIGCRRWQRSDLPSFLAFDPSVPTIIFVHGNQITPSDAKHEGLALYRRLVHYGANASPIRLVIFSWPSSRVGGLLRDVRVKATRTDPAGCQLAWLVDQIPAETPISLVGFSYGARIITASLHLLAGGNLGRLALTERVHADRPPMNVVLMAAALHAHWLGDGQYHGQALTQVNQMLLLNNRRDLAMRYYHLAFKGRGRPQALGLRGPTCLASEQRARIQLRDMSRYGSQHGLFLHLCAPGVPGQIWELAVGAPAATLQAAR
jgi:hypothetical protein